MAPPSLSVRVGWLRTMRGLALARALSMPELLWPVAAGIALRLFRIREQLLVGDELHTVKAVIAMPVREIVRTWTFHQADYCVPLTALLRFLIDRGAVLSEMHFRAAPLLAGIASTIVLPLLLAPRLGRRAAVLFGWLLALSPLLVLYSRAIRSYSITVLLAFIAVLAFEHWWRTRARASAVLYATLAPTAVYFHLGMASFVLAPFAFALIALALDRRAGCAPWPRQLGRIAGLALCTGGLIALLLFPARQSLLELLRLHGVGVMPSFSAWLHVARLSAGTAAPPLLGLLAVGVLRGVWVGSRSDPPFALYVGTICATHVAGLIALGPNFLEHASVTARYLLPILPFALAACALGLGHPISYRTSPREVRLQWLAVSLLLAAIFVTGPFATREFRWSSFLHAPVFVDLATSPDRMPERDVPAFYSRLGSDGETSALIEYPWDNTATHALAAYQRVHRRPVLISPAAPRRLLDPRLSLRNLVMPDPEAFIGSRARYLVIHPNLREEEAQVYTEEFHHARRLTEVPLLWSILQRTGSGMEARLRSAWGPPDFEDESIRVWDLDRLRSPERGVWPSEPATSEEIRDLPRSPS